MEEYLKKYYKLRAELDEEIRDMEKMHKSNLSCKKGCDSCCESISIFPIEFYAIKKEIANKQLPTKRLKHSFTKACRYLLDGECQIYESRPIICRTQGLPLLYENAEGNGFELSVCHLNFKGIDVNIFNKENALYMAPFNSKLFMLNQEFIKKAFPSKYKATSRIKNNHL